MDASAEPLHAHHFLGAAHAEAERRTFAVIALCTVTMLAEIAGGALFGSIALVADGLHMSTHAGALLLAGLAYRAARTRAGDPRFAFGTGKFGDLAGYSSAIVLALIAVLIAVEALRRLFAPVPIDFHAAIPIAGLGLAVNLASAWLLTGGGHHHHHHGHDHAEPARAIALAEGAAWLDIMENGVPPVFRLHFSTEPVDPRAVAIETIRPDGARQVFAFAAAGPNALESTETIPEPHEFTARIRIGATEATEIFTEHAHHAGTHRDNNLRAAVVHVLADAAVSLAVIAGLILAALFGWMWMDPAVGLIGAVVIASWAFTLIRDTGGILLDMTADPQLAESLRALVAAEGDRLLDLHLWRLGPGHLGAILAIETASGHDAARYHAALARFSALSHVTVEIRAPR
ncbi:MAG: CDF family Co(II)/Ni(II) efflux transporter DmeF [Rhodospirillales bacterium]|nr:CDF family Co(II)/Ni(II) efflux transporter DmeF [Rhodospirillales bacterium]